MSGSLIRTARGWAYFDLLATGLLAVPGISDAYLGALLQLNAGMTGTPVSPPLGGFSMLFVNLAGVLGVLWAIARLRTPLPTLSDLAWIDTLGRTVVAGLILYYVVALGAPVVLMGFVATEIGGAIAQFRCLSGGPPPSGE